MIINKGLASCLFEKCRKTGSAIQKSRIHNRQYIGNREWVGFGRTGGASYSDDYLYPFPSVRFRENTNELLALREKEKGDWRKLTMEEKKILYRSSFRQTLAEADAPTGEWKSVLGGTLFMVSVGLWCFILLKMFVYRPLPPTFSEEHRRAQLRKMLDMRMGIVNGISSKWDYEKDDWK